MILLALALAWLAGVASGALGVPFPPLMAALAGSSIALLRARGRGRLVVVLSALALGAVAAGGAVAFVRTRPRAGANDVASYIDVAGPKRVQGIISADRSETQYAVLLRLSVQRVETDAGWHAATGTLLVRAPLSLAYGYGDQIEVRGKLIDPPKFRDFDYQAYLAQQGIYAEMIYPSTHLIAQNQGNPWMARLVHLREGLAAGISSVLPAPEASLGAGVALGTSRVIQPSFKADLTNTGTTWLVVADGFKVMIIVGFLLSLARLIHRRVALLLCLPTILVYTVLAGFSPGVIRGAVLGGAFVCASLAGRPHGRGRTLALAAALLALLDPQTVSEASFWASLTAAAGILLLGEPLAQRLEQAWPAAVREGRWRGFVRAVSSTVALTIASTPAMLPVLFASTGQAPASSLAASAFLFPFVPLIMASSATVAAAATVSHPLAVILAPIAYLPLALMVGVVHGAGGLPAANLSAGWFGTGWASASYALAAAGVVLWRARRRYVWMGAAAGLRRLIDPLREMTGRLNVDARRRLTAVPVAVIGILAAVILVPLAVRAESLLVTALGPAEDSVRVTALDVGPGTAILVETRGRRVLIDGGPAGDATVRALDGRLPPWQRSLNLVVITDTADAEIGGLPSVLSRYKVDAILDASPPPAANKRPGPSSKALATALGVTNAIPVPPQPWTSVSLGAARLVIEQAQAGASAAAAAAAIPTVTLEAGSRRFLLTGDAVGAAPADVRFLPATQVQSPLQMPAVAVLETGPPARAASDLTGVPATFRSGLLYRTQENGAITLSTNGKHVRVNVSHGPKLGLFRQ